MKALKPYRRTKHKLFFKKGKQKMTITRLGAGNYKFDGDVIEGKIDIDFDNLIKMDTEISIHKA